MKASAGELAGFVVMAAVQIRSSFLSERINLFPAVPVKATQQSNTHLRKKHHIAPLGLLVHAHRL